MSEPSRSKFSSSDSSDGGAHAPRIAQAVSSAVRRIPFHEKIPRTAWAVAALGMLFLAIALELSHMPPAPGSARLARRGWEWWQTPTRLYPERTLPALDHAVIWTVEVVPNRMNPPSPQAASHRVWIAGEKGLLAYSDDRGEHWIKYEYDPASGLMVAPGSLKPEPWKPN